MFPIHNPIALCVQRVDLDTEPGFTPPEPQPHWPREVCFGAGEIVPKCYAIFAQYAVMHEGPPWLQVP